MNRKREIPRVPKTDREELQEGGKFSTLENMMILLSILFSIFCKPLIDLMKTLIIFMLAIFTVGIARSADPPTTDHSVFFDNCDYLELQAEAKEVTATSMDFESFQTDTYYFQANDSKHRPWDDSIPITGVSPFFDVKHATEANKRNAPKVPEPEYWPGRIKSWCKARAD